MAEAEGSEKMSSTTVAPSRFTQLRLNVRVSPAIVAAVALVIVQVGVGIIYKIAQQANGAYAFSQSSSIAISEFLKLAISTACFYAQCRKRQGITHPNDSHYRGDEGSGNEKVHDHDASPYDLVSNEENTRDSQDGTDKGRNRHTEQERQQRRSWIGPAAFFSAIRNETSSATVYGMAQLALLYAIINNTVFLLYRLSDPGTYALVKSGTTIVTALNLMISCGQPITRRQWMAIAFQVCGVMVTQYHPETGSLYPFSTYFLLVAQTVVSAVSGVYNQRLLKAESGSLHVCNMALYTAGTLINLVVHLTCRLTLPAEPSFFAGYNSSSAIMVIVSSVLIGLAINAVYKYADALVKCFASAVATGILLYVAPMVFAVPLSFLVIPGTITVFVATWLYIDSAKPKEEISVVGEWEEAKVEYNEDHSWLQKAKATYYVYAPSGKRAYAGLIITTTAVVAIITMLGQVQVKPQSTVPVVESPFKNSMAFIRWNHYQPERIPTLKKFGPFFKAVHISMPNYRKKEGKLGKHYYTNLNGSNAQDIFHPYVDVSRTMQMLLDAPEGSTEASIDGLFFFHFDAWIYPLRFRPEDMNRIWWLDSTAKLKWECVTTTKGDNWWYFPQRNSSMRAKAAVADAMAELKHEVRERINPREFCRGWSDIYWIPRHYFEDYIRLSKHFLNHKVFHEVALPTMIHTIDVMRRTDVDEDHEIIYHLSDCFGGCCNNYTTKHDLIWRRCGHKLDLRDKKLSNTFYNRLDATAQTLGKPLWDSTKMQPLLNAETIFESSWNESMVKEW